MKEYLSDTKEILKQLSTSERGLCRNEAERRLEEYGPNRLAEKKKTPVIVRFLRELADPMTIVLIAAAAVSLITALIEGGGYADVIIILSVVLINAVLGVLQESKAEQAIAALKELTPGMSRVRRDGDIITVKSEELVRGDVVLLEAGDSIPADGRLIECASLKTEESALTGESLPVEKQTQALSAKGDVPLGDRKNMVYMGSTAVFGRGEFVVTAAGMDTEMGKIAGTLAAAKDDETPLQKKLAHLSKVLSMLVLAICAAILSSTSCAPIPTSAGAICSIPLWPRFPSPSPPSPRGFPPW